MVYPTLKIQINILNKNYGMKPASPHDLNSRECQDEKLLYRNNFLDDLFGMNASDRPYVVPFELHYMRITEKLTRNELDPCRNTCLS